MTGDPRKICYLAANVRELDRLAIEEFGIPGYTLIQRAGSAAFNALLARWPKTRSVLCCCGSGNNGGDGYVIAALARRKNLRATVIAVGNPANLGVDARRAYEMAMVENVQIIPFATVAGNFSDLLAADTVIVDAMLGTGLTGDVRGDYAKAITLINKSNTPVLAVDIPSGLCSDTGRILGTAVHADLTVTFIGRKLGQVTGQGPSTCGTLVFDDLGVPDGVYASLGRAGT